LPGTNARYNERRNILLRPGANPATSAFTTTTPALWLARALFKAEEYVFKTYYATRGGANFYSVGSRIYNFNGIVVIS
jgi:hypothetical protein